jgi:hypothetical protein
MWQAAAALGNVWRVLRHAHNRSHLHAAGNCVLNMALAELIYR